MEEPFSRNISSYTYQPESVPFSESAVYKQTAYLCLGPAIKTGQLEEAAKYAVLATAMPRPPDTESGTRTFDAFLLDHIVASVVHLAIEVAGDSDSAAHIDAAWQAAGAKGVAENNAAKLLLY
jgi:hypothetical protein